MIIFHQNAISENITFNNSLNNRNASLSTKTFGWNLKRNTSSFYASSLEMEQKTFYCSCLRLSWIYSLFINFIKQSESDSKLAKILSEREA